MHFAAIYISLLCLTVLPLQWTRAENKIDLGGKWSLSRPTIANRTVNIPAMVPGGVYTALMAAKLIDDPYVGNNDVMYRYVPENSWTYYREYNLTKEQLTFKSIFLVCEGLDTIASISVNGKRIGESSNMFVRYEYDLKKALKTGINNISVTFESAIEYALNAWKAHTAYDVPPDCPPKVQNGICHPNFIRKEQSSFGWDWGPAFAPQGIWKDIRIETYNCAVLRNVVPSAIPGSESSVSPWSVNITVHFELGSGTACSGILTMSFPKLNVSHKAMVTLTPKQTSISMKLFVPMAGTWWPAGFGAQPLYDLLVKFESGESKEVSSKSLKFGFRHVELVQEEIADSKGLSFYFKINHRPIFLKGANWIPPDAFQERISRDRLANLLQSLVDANMHATRVWGGGVYEQDAFYEICDELGIVVWQDFQFACAMYPAGLKFLNSVTTEVVQQVRRLSSHPSVIAWSANNENEVALRQNWYGTNKSFALYKEDYVHLYIDTILEALKTENSPLPAVSSSPSNGPETAKEGWVAKNPSDPHYGDVHYYNYKEDCWDWTIYPKPRFASEYGFQSWPSFDTLRQVSKEGDWSMDSNFSTHRQHHQHGNNQMMTQINKHFIDTTTKNKTQRFINRIYLTQISQALCYKFETEHYRRFQSHVTDGEGRTMGTVYWQLNDIWQAPSWASLEYGGKWKMLHYYAKDFYAPFLASAIEDNMGNLVVYSITDVINIDHAILNITLWSWDSFVPVEQLTQTFSNQPAPSAKVIYNKPMANILPPKCAVKSPCYLTLQVTAIQPRLTSPVNPYFFFMTLFNDRVGIQPPNITFEIFQKDANSFDIVLSTESPAPFVWMEAHGIRGRFSNNGFLMNHVKRSELFYAWEPTTVDKLKKALTVTSLTDIYKD